MGALFLLIGIICWLAFEKHCWKQRLAIRFTLLSVVMEQPVEVTWGCLAMILITVLKHLEANRARLPKGPERWSTIWRRIWLDRDIADHEE